jgi:hypothetical protein
MIRTRYVYRFDLRFGRKSAHIQRTQTHIAIRNTASQSKPFTNRST